MSRIALKPLLLAVAVACGASASVHAADDAATRVKALNALLAEQWEYTLKHQPEFATMLGDYRYNDRWSDASPAAAQQQKKDNEAFLARFKTIDTSGFDEQDRLNQQLMLRQLSDNIRTVELKLNEMPLDQFNGVHLMLPQFVSMVPFETSKQYEEYLARLNALPALFEQITETLRQGEKDKMLPPRFLLEKVVTQMRDIAKPAGEDSVFGHPVAKFPDGVAAADRKRLHDAILKAVDEKVRPAYTKLADFVEKDYAPKGRTEPGMWALPNGDALYKFSVEQQTTTNKSPQEIHDLGLAEVKRIEGEQLKIAQKQGYKDLKTFREAMNKDPKTHATSRQQIVDLYKKYIAQMEPKLPQLFGTLPKAKVEVVAIPAYMAANQAQAYYEQGTPDGKRPGRVNINTYNFADRSLTDAETVAYHEGIPGHHLQISVQQELKDLPPFRQQAYYTAYTEGWGLYAERLGKEVGFYQDPYSDYGRLEADMWRAIRLVVDTGVHSQHWTRQQMVDFFHTHSTLDETNIQSEVDRYIAWPAQALGYKMGQLEILALRDKAQKALGQKFDLHAFHDVVIDSGALPMDTLEKEINAWIAAQSGTAAAK